MNKKKANCPAHLVNKYLIKHSLCTGHSACSDNFLIVNLLTLGNAGSKRCNDIVYLKRTMLETFKVLKFKLIKNFKINILNPFLSSPKLCIQNYVLKLK